MEIIRLEEKDNTIFETIVNWYYNWLGIKNEESLEEVKYTFSYSLNKTKLPQTFVAIKNNKPVGMYQLAITDDLYCRPDLYPWLINVYVDKDYRNQKVCTALMETVYNNAKNIGLKELYLYTTHIGLYEKFGWKFVEEVKTFKKDEPIQRLYKLEIN